MVFSQKIQKFSQWLLYLTMLVPLFMSASFLFPYISLKNFIFRCLILLVSLIVWYSVCDSGKVAGKRHYLWYAWLIFLLVQIVATIFGANPYRSFWGNYERMDGLLNIIFLTLYFWTLINTMVTTKAWFWLFRVALVGSWGVIFFDILYRLGVQDSFFGNASTIGNTAFLGSFLLLNFFITAILYYLDKNKPARIFYLMTAIALLVVILINASRGSILGLLLGGFVWVLFYSLKKSTKIKYIFLGAVLTLGLFTGLVLAQKNSTWVQNTLFLKRLTSISKTDDSTNNRLLTWQVAYRAWQDHPLLGYGPENTVYGINKYYNPNITEEWFDRAHNFVFDYLGTSGVLGLAAYLAIFIVAVWSLWRLSKKDYQLAIILLALLTAYLFSNLFVFDTINTWLLVIAVLAFIGFLSHADGSEYHWQWSVKWQNLNYLWICLGLIVGIFVAYTTLIMPIRVNTTAINAMQNYTVDPNKTLEFYQQALNYNTFGNIEIAFQLTQYSLKTMDAKDFSYQLLKQIFEEAEKRDLLVLKQDPAELRIRLALAELYQKYSINNSFYIDESINLVESHLSDSPRRLENYTILAQGYYLKKDLVKSLEYLEKILTLSQRRESDYLNAMNIASQLGQADKVQAYINEFYQRFPNSAGENYRKIGQYYFQIGLVDKAEQVLLERAIPSDPTNANMYVSLASIYEYQKQYQKAIDYLNGILAKYPDNTAMKTTIDGYIKYLEDLKSGKK